MSSHHVEQKVWDPIVRIGHWVLVLGFFTAYLTGESNEQVHVWAGYIVAIVVGVRIVWGLIGTKHARFTDFIYRPSAVWTYLKHLMRRKPQHFVGHNPAGGAMVIALLISLSMTAYSGMAILAIEEHEGPLAPIYAQQAQHTNSIIKTAYASGMHGEESIDSEAEERWEERHEFFVNLTLLLVLLHIGGVIASSIVDQENLIKAMFTGKKVIQNDNQPPKV